jgi:hypothetical protein
MITPDEAGRAMLEKALKGVAYDCVVIGGGLRIPPKSLALFEMVVNAVHKAAPGATIAFNTRPEDTADAAAANSMPANGLQNATTRSAYAVPWLLSAASAWHLKMRMMHSGLEKHNLCHGILSTSRRCPHGQSRQGSTEGMFVSRRRGNRGCAKARVRRLIGRLCMRRRR